MFYTCSPFFCLHLCSVIIHFKGTQKSKVPIDNGFPVQVFQPTADLSSVELDPLSVKARGAHVVDVKLQVSTIHDGQHQTQSIFGLICIC